MRYFGTRRDNSKTYFQQFGSGKRKDGHADQFGKRDTRQNLEMFGVTPY